MPSSADIQYWIPLPSPIGLALAALLGLLWMMVLAPRGWWRWRIVWLGIGAGVILFPPAIAWVQVPLQIAVGSWLVSAFGQEALRANLLLASIPQTLISGIVQEAARLLPLIAYVLLVRPSGVRRLLQVGAAVGAGFGAVEAAWAFGLVFAAGWTLDTVQAAGWLALIPFVERLFVVGLHTALGVILAYGLVRGIAPATFLLALLLHSIVNYGVAFAQAGLLGVEGVELYIAFWSLATVGIALWLTRRALRADAEGDAP